MTLRGKISLENVIL